MSISKKEIKKELKQGVTLMMSICPLEDFLSEVEAKFLYRVYRESPGDWGDEPKEELRDKILDGVTLDDIVITDAFDESELLSEDEVVDAIKSLIKKGLVEFFDSTIWVHWDQVFLLRFKTLNHIYNYF